MLFDEFTEPECIELQHSRLVIHRGYLDKAASDDLYAACYQGLPWLQDSLNIIDQTIPIPRLHAWLCDYPQDYVWSGLRMKAVEIPKFMSELLARLRESSGIDFNSCLANLYRHQQDSVDWHADDEVLLGDKPQIASISLGEERQFQIRSKSKSVRTSLKLDLNHGDLVLMLGEFQRYYEHRLIKSKHPCRARINLSFRNLSKLS